MQGLIFPVSQKWNLIEKDKRQNPLVETYNQKPWMTVLFEMVTPHFQKDKDWAGCVCTGDIWGSFNTLIVFKKILKWGAWVAQSFKHLISAQVMISWFMRSSPTSALHCRQEPAWDPLSPSLSLPLLHPHSHSLTLTLSLSLSLKNN